MSLPDFTEFDAFNELRERMGADKLGHFEWFDPVWHLTGQERSDLERQSLQIHRDRIMALLDFTLVFKNSRVLVLDTSCYHICNCKRLPSELQLSVATSLRPTQTKALNVCRDCLQTLHYQGYDLTKARKEAYSHQVFETFKLAAFWRQYPMYPVSEKREKRKPISWSASGDQPPS